MRGLLATLRGAAGTLGPAVPSEAQQAAQRPGEEQPGGGGEVSVSWSHTAVSPATMAFHVLVVARSGSQRGHDSSVTGAEVAAAIRLRRAQAHRALEQRGPVLDRGDLSHSGQAPAEKAQ